MPPALALAGAAASVAGGMAAVGGTMAGFMAAGIGTQLVAGAMIGGGVLSGIGAITGNKKLQKWGGILSIAGGIGGLASGAWSTVANEAASAGFGGAEYGMAEAAAGATGSGGMLNAASLGTTDLGIGAASAGQGGVMQAPMTPGINGAAPAIAPPPTMTAPAGVGGQASAVGQTVSKVADAGSSMLSSIGDKVKPAFEWMEKNPRITQAGAGLLTSGLSGYAQQQALQDQMRMQEEAQARARQRMSDSQYVKMPVYQSKGG